MKKFTLAGALAGTLSLFCATAVFAESDSTILEHYLQGSLSGQKTAD